MSCWIWTSGLPSTPAEEMHPSVVGLHSVHSIVEGSPQSPTEGMDEREESTLEGERNYWDGNSISAYCIKHFPEGHEQFCGERSSR